MINDTRYYTLNEEAKFDEDRRHEFKNHNSFTSDNITALTKKLHMMQPISKTINAFLNSGEGGTVYIGINDFGIVKGKHLTELQRDHFQLSLDELLKHYRPAVPKSWVHLEFVRVVSDGREFEEEQLRAKNRYVNKRLKPHSLGYAYCWCFDDAKDRVNNMNEHVPSFVVEIHIQPWDPNDRNNENIVTTKTRLHPIFEDEVGDIYLRRSGGNSKYTKEEILQITVDEVKEYFMKKQ